MVLRVRPRRLGIWENLGRSVVDLGRRARRAASGTSREPLLHASFIAMLLLAALALMIAFEDFGLLQLPELAWSITVIRVMAGLALVFSVLTYFDARRSTAFYRRFLRPGLKHLVDLRGESLYRGEKLFRGRRTVIMKVDIAGYTRDTFPMPYGMRRAFLDLWYTLIDQVVADRVFFDKSLGDGSFYCFEGELPGGSCHAALRAALEVRERQVPAFDRTFRRVLEERLRSSAELREPAERFLLDYQATNGVSFWQRATRTRISLVSGYVDEGLWGLSSQSHYDVQGTLVIVATRLESAAAEGEIVFDENFLLELEHERPGCVDQDRLEQRVARLKGVGLRRLLVVPPGVSPFVEEGLGTAVGQ